MLRYSNLIGDDLSPFNVDSGCSDGPTAGDVGAVKKILLEDYMTEVRELVREESRKVEEERILENVKQRMDDDLVDQTESLRSDESWHSLVAKPSSCQASYVTACDCSCCCCCCWNRRSNVQCMPISVKDEPTQTYNIGSRPCSEGRCSTAQSYSSRKSKVFGMNFGLTMVRPRLIGIRNICLFKY